MSFADYFIFSWATSLIVVGLIFTASGFGIFVVSRLEGFVMILIGLAMFWGGWVMSGARGFPCAAAALLNVFDAASTVAFWNFELNPFVLKLGPTLFLIAKIAASLSIMLYAKLYSNPKKGGILLSVFFAIIVGWNLSQHLRAYLDLMVIDYALFLGAAFSFTASAIVLFAIFISERLEKRTTKLVSPAR
ncbi:MAG: hypothetical protein OEY22_00180 [Candidatus Bathyarchaeota archaeon]|nr:hypothetical protein [Candidatus Bathyarchaeota archaeon]MDH5788178.1 hypothetical protein [Candidatus Bathyarchaeota archaeon]